MNEIPEYLKNYKVQTPKGKILYYSRFKWNFMLILIWFFGVVSGFLVSSVFIYDELFGFLFISK